MRFHFDIDDREVWYRYEDYATAPPLNLDGDPMPGPGGVRIILRRIPVVRHTPCGVQLDLGDGRLRFVNRTWTKRYACPTKEEARASFMARKRRQHSILTAQAHYVERVINEALKELYDESEHREQPLFA